ncbi:MAG: hypothetical protein WBV31_20970 [Terriglobales bacterium]|jgi:hypothetical protein
MPLNYTIVSTLQLTKRLNDEGHEMSAKKILFARTPGSFGAGIFAAM